MSDVKERKLLETIRGGFYVEGRRVFKTGDENRYSDGSRSIKLNIPICEAWEHLTDPEGAARMISDALNASQKAEPIHPDRESA